MTATGMIKVGGAAALGLAALVGLGRMAGLDLSFGAGGETGIEGAEVRRGDLRISVVERANLKAANSVDLKCELEGRSTILWLIEEGSIVEPGELVCELDTSSQIERRVQQEIAVQNAEAVHIKAVQNLAIQQSQNESDIKSAEQQLSFAEIDLLKYKNAEYPQLKAEAEEAITLAEEDLTRKQNELEWSQKLMDKGHLTRTELEADQFAFNSASILLEQRRRASTLLEDYDHPRTLAELQANVEEAKRELDRVKLQAEARIAEFEADERTSKAKLDLETEELEKLLDQIAKAKITAPVAGMIVYAKEERSRWGSGDPIQEGTEVRERQEIITIPSSEGMVAEMTLHESVLEKVREGMPCLITVGALQGRQLTGRVRFKSTLPDQNSWWANPDLRVYRSEVEVLETVSDLKSGMSCSVEVVVDDLVDVLHAPVQSIFLNRGEPAVFLSQGGEIELRPVEVGQDNGKWVEIKSGVEEGDVVLLAQPAGWTLEPAIEEPISLEDLPAFEPPGRGGPPQRGGPTERGAPYDGAASRGGEPRGGESFRGGPGGSAQAPGAERGGTRPSPGPERDDGRGSAPAGSARPGEPTNDPATAATSEGASSGGGEPDGAASESSPGSEGGNVLPGADGR